MLACTEMALEDAALLVLYHFNWLTQMFPESLEKRCTILDRFAENSVFRLHCPNRSCFPLR